MNTTIKFLILALLLCATLLLCTTCSSEVASVRKAEMFKEHGLPAEAKKELIDVLFGDAEANEKAEAYYLLGGISFNEERITTALDTWNSLVEDRSDVGSRRCVVVVCQNSALLK